MHEMAEASEACQCFFGVPAVVANFSNLIRARPSSKGVLGNFAPRRCARTRLPKRDHTFTSMCQKIGIDSDRTPDALHFWLAPGRDVFFVKDNAHGNHDRRSATRGSERVESSVGSGEFTLFTERIAAPACARSLRHARFLL